MCGRYPSTRAAPLVDAVEVAMVEDDEVAGVVATAPGMPAGLASWWAPRWNVAPTQPVRAIVLVDGAARLTLVRWGLMPPPRGPSLAPVINARAETAATSPLFRGAMAQGRCLIVADGFYEWRGTGQARTPVRFAPDAERAITIAGLARRWHRDGVAITEAAIVTTAASPLVASFHERQPAVIAPDDRARWLDASVPVGAVQGLLAPAALLGWSATDAPPWISNARNERAAARA